MARAPITDKLYASRLDILRRAHDGKATPQEAADELASISLLEDNIELTWATIVSSAREFPEQQQTLVAVLVCVAQSGHCEDEPLRTSDGMPLRDLPRLGWDFNHEWNGKHELFIQR